MDKLSYNGILKIFSHFQLHSDFIDELMSLIKNSGCEIEVYKKIAFCLNLIEKLNNSELMQSKHFEPLKNCNNLYSMKIFGNFNIRIIFSYLENGQIFLHTFFERGGKRKTDYTEAIIIAKKRLKEINEGGYHEHSKCKTIN